MSRPVACFGHVVEGTDLHLVVPPPPAPPTPLPVPLPFRGRIIATAPVWVNGLQVALDGDVVVGDAHQPPSGMTFAPQFLTNAGTLIAPPNVVLLIGGRAAAAQGDMVATCQFSGPTPTSMVTEGDPSLVVP
ncbi:MAG: hypothetical protein U0325_33760 [Polyangiales bacterium]